MVSIPAFYSDNLSLNPARHLNFLFQKTEINEKEAGVGPSLKKFNALICLVSITEDQVADIPQPNKYLKKPIMSFDHLEPIK